jgi:hypothetical protein
VKNPRVFPAQNALSGKTFNVREIAHFVPHGKMQTVKIERFSPNNRPF